MMAEKARLFGDEHHLDLILAAATPGEAKKLGRHVQGFQDDVWNQHRLDIVARGSVAKFSSNESMRDYLIGTGDRVLVEASPRDRIWGIGMGKNNPSAEPRKKMSEFGGPVELEVIEKGKLFVHEEFPTRTADAILPTIRG